MYTIYNLFYNVKIKKINAKLKYTYTFNIHK